MWLNKSIGSISRRAAMRALRGGLAKNQTTIRKQTFLVCELRVLVNSAILKKRLGRTGTNMQPILEATNKVRANQSFKSAHVVRPTTNRSLCSRLVAA